jgi:hypothetical protein
MSLWMAIIDHGLCDVSIIVSSTTIIYCVINNINVERERKILITVLWNKFIWKKVSVTCCIFQVSQKRGVGTIGHSSVLAWEKLKWTIFDGAL